MGVFPVARSLQQQRVQSIPAVVAVPHSRVLQSAC
jgi:hypothetical protein